MNLALDRAAALPPLAEAVAAPAVDYEDSFVRVLSSLSATETRHAEERLLGALQWSALRGLSQTAREARVTGEEAFHHRGFVHVALERARTLGRSAPRRAMAAAELAVAVTEWLAGAGTPSPELAADLEAEALGAVGEARRQAGRLDAAQGALEIARLRLAEGTGEPLAAAELLRREARLAVELGDPEAAFQSLAEARALYLEIDDRPALGRVLLAEARLLGRSDPALALQRTETALRLLDPVDDPRADVRGFLQLGWHLVDAGRAVEARAVLDAPQTYGCAAGTHERLLRLWLTARVARALGRPGEAAPAFAEVAAGWRAVDRLRPRVFATLDQIEALQAAGRLPAAATAVRSLRCALRRRSFHGQGLRILDQLALAFDDGRAGSEACPAMIDYLHSAWHRPLPTPDTSASEADDAHSPVAG
jgi:tetratricopeptide (TPR) repeat protein